MAVVTAKFQTKLTIPVCRKLKAGLSTAQLVQPFIIPHNSLIRRDKCGGAGNVDATMTDDGVSDITDVVQLD